MSKSLNDWSHKELMALPVRGWDKVSVYDSLLIVSSRKKHDSGWACMAIIGVNGLEPIEIASACSDDIEWRMPAPDTFGDLNQYKLSDIRSDMAFKSGAIHFWATKHRFKVGCALSSIYIDAVPTNKEAK